MHFNIVFEPCNVRIPFYNHYLTWFYCCSSQTLISQSRITNSASVTFSTHHLSNNLYRATLSQMFADMHACKHVCDYKRTYKQLLLNNNVQINLLRNNQTCKLNL